MMCYCQEDPQRGTNMGEIAIKMQKKSIQENKFDLKQGQHQACLKVQIWSNTGLSNQQYRISILFLRWYIWLFLDWNGYQTQWTQCRLCVESFNIQGLECQMKVSRADVNTSHIYCGMYRKVFNIRRTKSQNLNVSCLILQFSLPNPLKPDVKLRMKWSTILLPMKVRLILETWW